MKHDKYLFIDTETTGIDPSANGIHHISGLFEIEGKVKERFDLRSAPFPDDIIDDEALRIGGVTKEQIMGYKPAVAVHKVFTTLMAKYVDKFNRDDKLVLVGYNIDFDDKMLRAWFRKLGDKYYGSWIAPYKIDVYSITAMFRYLGFLKTPNLKLMTVAEHLKIEHEAHKSLSDIEATREIFKWCCKHIIDPAEMEKILKGQGPISIGASSGSENTDQHGREAGKDAG